MDGNKASAGESSSGAHVEVKRRRVGWLTLGALVTAAMFFFWPLVFHVKHLVPFHVLAGDPALQGIDLTSDRPDWRIFDDSPITTFYAEKTLVARELHHGEWPLWNPFNGLGAPLLADGQSQPFAPFFIPFILHPTPWTYSWVLLLQLLFGGFGAALLLRRLGAGPVAQTFAGLLFAFNPYALNYLIYSDVWAYVWFPWVLLAAEGWVGRERGGALTAILIALMAMSGHVEVAFFGAVSVFVYLAIRFSQEGGWRKNRQGWIALPVLTAAISAWWLLPFMEYVKNSTSSRFGGNVCFPYHPSACFVVGSELFWQPVLLFLATIGFLAPARRRFGLALLPGFMWSLVMMFPFPMVLQKAATFDLLSGRYGRSVAWFVLIVCAGLGLDAIGKKSVPRWVLSVGVLVLLTWLGLGLVIRTPSSAVAEAHHWVPLQGNTLVHFTWIIVLNLLALALVLLPRRWWSAGRLAVALAVLTLVGSLFYHSYFNVYWNNSEPRLASAVRANVAPKRGRTWFPNRGTWRSLPPNLSCAFGLRDVRFNDPLRPKALEALYKDENPHMDVFQEWPAAFAGFLGVNAAWTIEGDEERSRLTLHPNPHPYPRAMWFPDAEFEKTDSEALSAALRGGAWKRTLFLTTPMRTHRQPRFPVERCSAEVTVVADSYTYSSWKVTAPRQGWLLLRDLAWPGWRARVGGRAAGISVGDGVFRAVAVPAGESTVTFRYKPALFMFGFLVTILCLLAFGVRRWVRIRWCIRHRSVG